MPSKNKNVDVNAPAEDAPPTEDAPPAEDVTLSTGPAAPKLENAVGEKRKKAPNPFMQYSKQNRQSIRDQYPDMKMTEISKKLGENWKALSAEEKDLYRAKSVSGD